MTGTEPSNVKDVTSAHDAPCSGNASSKNPLAHAMTRAPRAASYPPALGKSPNASVPYKASYRLPQRAFAAFNANRAFMIGTTSCGPGIVAISGSTLAVSISNSGPSGNKYPISFRNAVYSAASCSCPRRATCHASICACISSRLANNSRFFGPRS